jgi:hypothetical protein
MPSDDPFLEGLRCVERRVDSYFLDVKNLRADALDGSYDVPFSCANEVIRESEYAG